MSDNKDPEIQYDSGSVSVGTGDTVTLYVNATDNIDVTSANVSIDSGTGVAMTYDVVDERWEYDYTAPLNDDSDHTYTLTVYDAEINSDSSGPYAITVSDNDKPQITNVQADPIQQVVNGYVNITATVQDNIGLNQVKVNITGPGAFPPINTSMNLYSGDDYYYNQVYTEPGTYDYFIWVNDTSGQKNMSSTYQFTIVNELNITYMRYDGWNFIALPFNQVITKSNIKVVNETGVAYTWSDAVTNGLVLTFIYDWNRTNQLYNNTDSLEPGYGYWVYTYEENITLVGTGITFAPATGYITDLEVGWNTVGVPTNQSVDVTDLIVVYGDLTEHSWDEAVDDGKVIQQIYYYKKEPPVGYEDVSSSSLAPGLSHWIYAWETVTLKWDIT